MPGPYHARTLEGVAKSHFSPQGGSFQKLAAPILALEKISTASTHLVWRGTTEGPSWGHSRVVLGAILWAFIAKN
jgi:hypothetical protein